MPRNPNLFLALWDRALESEIGIAITTNQPQILRQELYKAKAESNNPEFDQLIMFIPADKGEVFLCRKSVELEG